MRRVIVSHLRRYTVANNSFVMGELPTLGADATVFRLCPKHDVTCGRCADDVKGRPTIAAQPTCEGWVEVQALHTVLGTHVEFNCCQRLRVVAFNEQNEHMAAVIGESLEP